MERSRSLLLLPAAFVCAVTACASKQTIPLDCIPEEVVVYVDGERLDELPPELNLRRDEPHTIFMKGPGMKPELVVLRSEEISGRRMLTPASICLHPRRIEVRRELQFEIDPETSAVPASETSASDDTVDVVPPPEFPSGGNGN